MAGPRRIAVVGASLAAARVVRGLRRRGFDGEVVLVGAEEHLPYDRPPLSKEFLAGAWDADRLALEPEGTWDGVELRLGTAAVALRPAERQVVLVDGSTVTADHVVVATGAAARSLPDQPALDGVFVLRTRDDATALREALADATGVVVVGAGFVGAEVAATARGRGLDVTVLDPLQAPVVRGLGPRLGGHLARIHRDHGVDLRLGVGVDALLGTDRVTGVRLHDGGVVSGDVVVVGIGATPNTGWLRGSGVPLDDGVRCDPLLRVEGFEGLWAAGDVCRWESRRYGEHVRLEHWTNAADQGMAVAANILAGPDAAPFDPVPYVWSDQYDTKVQVLGRVAPEDEVTIVAGGPDDGRLVATATRGGRLRGVVGFGWPRAVMGFRPLLEEAATTERVREHAASLG